MKYKIDLDCKNLDKYYVYKHYFINHNNKEVVFYIGKGKENRILSTHRNHLWEHIVFKVLKGKYYAEIIKYFDKEEDALKYETELQVEYYSKGQCLGCADIEYKYRKYQKNKLKHKYHYVSKDTYIENNNFLILSINHTSYVSKKDYECISEFIVDTIKIRNRNIYILKINKLFYTIEWENSHDTKTIRIKDRYNKNRKNYYCFDNIVVHRLANVDFYTSQKERDIQYKIDEEYLQEYL